MKDRCPNCGARAPKWGVLCQCGHRFPVRVACGCGFVSARKLWLCPVGCEWPISGKYLNTFLILCVAVPIFCVYHYYGERSGAAARIGIAFLLAVAWSVAFFMGTKVARAGLQLKSAEIDAATPAELQAFHKELIARCTESQRGRVEHPLRLAVSSSCGFGIGAYIAYLIACGVDADINAGGFRVMGVRPFLVFGCVVVALCWAYAFLGHYMGKKRAKTILMTFSVLLFFAVVAIVSVGFADDCRR